MRAIREILLTEYIGAILVGVLIADAASTLVVTGVGQVSRYIQSRHNPLLNSRGFSATYSLLDGVVRTALYLLVAYLIARWLYPATTTQSQESGQSIGVR